MIFFLDFEASSPGRESYPIEVAWVSKEGQGESYLIRPHESWRSRGDWSPDAERVHGISRETLMAEGRSAAWVARHAASSLATAEAIYSDAHGLDGRWLRQLLLSAALPDLIVQDAYTLYEQEVQPFIESLRARYPGIRDGDVAREVGDLLDSVRAADAMRPGRRHRALRDAESLWWQWSEIRSRVARRIHKIEK